MKQTTASLFHILIPEHWTIRFKSFVARILIKFKKLTYSAYSAEQLNQIVAKELPERFDIDVPRGKGILTILQAKLSMHVEQDYISVNLLCGFDVESLNSLIYRAHVAISLQVLPDYDVECKQLFSQDTKVTGIHLVNDEYSILKDTRSLMKKFFPSAVTLLFADTMKNALNRVTAGTTDTALNYFTLYLEGSKQRILDYHKPQIEALIQKHTARNEFYYPLNPDDWEEQLFIDLGKGVAVEEGELRFRF